MQKWGTGMGPMRACWQTQRKQPHSARSISPARKPERCFAEIRLVIDISAQKQGF
jgi:hypothetical protein